MILLIGFMASGKSSIARELAEALQVEDIDLDTLIEDKSGTTIAQLFRERGEDEFRRVETEVLREVLHQNKAGRVVATGGGIVLREENRVLLRHAAKNGTTVVYLKADPNIIAQRIRRQPGIRPVIDGDKLLNLEETRDRVMSLLEMRGPLYEESASLTIDSGQGTPAEIAQEIQRQIAEGNS